MEPRQAESWLLQVERLVFEAYLKGDMAELDRCEIENLRLRCA
jgi:hypothetical protein